MFGYMMKSTSRRRYIQRSFLVFLILFFLPLSVLAGCPLFLTTAPKTPLEDAEPPGDGSLLLFRSNYMTWPEGPWGKASPEWPAFFDIQSTSGEQTRRLILSEPPQTLQDYLSYARYLPEGGEDIGKGDWSLIDVPALHIQTPAYHLGENPVRIETEASLVLVSGEYFCARTTAMAPTSGASVSCHTVLRVRVPDSWSEHVSDTALLKIRLTLEPEGSVFDAPSDAIETFVSSVWTSEEGYRFLTFQGIDYFSCTYLDIQWYGAQHLVGTVWPHGVENPEDLMLYFEIDLEEATQEMDRMYEELQALLGVADEESRGCASVATCASPVLAAAFVIVLAWRRRRASLGPSLNPCTEPKEPGLVKITQIASGPTSVYAVTRPMNTASASCSTTITG